MTEPTEMRMFDSDEPVTTKDTRAVRVLIGGGLGHVEVSESGELTAVEIDERTMRTTRADLLAEHIMAALVRAREEASARNREVLRRRLGGYHR